MIHFSTRVAAFGAALVLAATGTAVGATQAQAAPSKTPTATPTCHTSNLRLSVGRVTGGAGSSFYPIRFTNVSGHTCLLRGYPGVSVLDRHRHQIGAPATRNPHRVVTVKVRPTRTVSAVVRTNNPGVGPSCRPTSSFIRVFPPASTQAVLIHFHLRVCGAFEVNPVSFAP